MASPPARPRLEPGVTSRPRGLWRLELDGSSADSLSVLRGEEIAVQATGRFNRLTLGIAIPKTLFESGTLLERGEIHPLQR